MEPLTAALARTVSRGTPYGTRTRVSAVKGRRPRPLDEGRNTQSCREAKPRRQEPKTGQWGLARTVSLRLAQQASPERTAHRTRARRIVKVGAKPPSEGELFLRDRSGDPEAAPGQQLPELPRATQDGREGPRGLRGAKPVVTDDHMGLRAAARRVFDGGGVKRLFRWINRSRNHQRRRVDWLEATRSPMPRPRAASPWPRCSRGSSRRRPRPRRRPIGTPSPTRSVRRTTGSAP